MKRRNRDGIHLPKRKVEEKPEIFTMTQEEFADPVTWDESDHPAFASTSEMHDHENEIFDMDYGDDDENSNGSFMWRELEQKNKRRRAATPAQSTSSQNTTLQSIGADVAFLTGNINDHATTATDNVEAVACQEAPAVNNVVNETVKTDESGCPQTTIGIPSAMEIIPTAIVQKAEVFGSQQNHVNHCEAQGSVCNPNLSHEQDFDISISEDDFERMEQEAIQKQQMQNRCQTQATSELQSNITAAQHEDIEDDGNSQAYIDLLDEIERQAATAAVAQVGTTIQSQKTMVSLMHQHEDLQDSLNVIPLELPDLACIRLIALEVEDRRPVHRKFIQATLTQTEKDKGESNTFLGRTKIIVELCDDWYDTVLEKGDIFHVINVGSQLLANAISDMNVPQKGFNNSIIKMHTQTETRIVITNEHGLLSLCPDVLISPTKVAESCTCTRRGVLSDRIRSFGMSAASAVMGNVRHSFIEALTERVLEIINSIGSHCFSEQDVVKQLPRSEMDSIMKHAIEEYVEDLYCIHKSDEDILQDLFAAISPTMSWISIAAKEGLLALTTKHTAHPNITTELYQQVHDYKVTEVMGIEESIYSPVLGIKGTIDMIAGGSIASIMNHKTSSQASMTTLPIEFKTGRWKPSTATAHRAQVILYILLMMMRRSTMKSMEESNDNHNNNASTDSITSSSNVSKYGLVLYICDREMKVDFIKPEWYDLRALMMSRNGLAKGIYSSTHSSNHALTTSVSNAAVVDLENGGVILTDRILGSTVPPINGTSSASSSSLSLTTSLTVYDNNYSSSNEQNKTITRLPPMLKSQHECSFCYSAAECLMYHASIENGNDMSSGVSLLYNYVLKGISHKHIQYLKHWDHLIDLESIVNEDSIQTLWSMTGPQRELSGAKCLGKLILTNVTVNNNASESSSNSNSSNGTRLLRLVSETRGDSGRITPGGGSSGRNTGHNLGNNGKNKVQVLITLSRNANTMKSEKEREESCDITSSSSVSTTSSSVKRERDSLQDSPFMIGDRVLVSIEQLVAFRNKDNAKNKAQDSLSRDLLSAINANICSGTIQTISKTSIEILIVQGYRSILNLQKVDRQKIVSEGWFFRIDKDDSNVNISTMRSNLMELFVEPFNPSMFKDANRSFSRSNSTNGIGNSTNSAQDMASLPLNQALFEKSVKGNFIRQRMRELVVDLREPLFRNIPGPLNFAVQPNRPITKNLTVIASSLSLLKANLVEMDYEIMFHLFCPLNMDKKVFQIAMKSLMLMTKIHTADISSCKDDGRMSERIEVQAGSPLTMINNNTIGQGIGTSTSTGLGNSNNLHVLMKDINLLKGDDDHVIITPSEVIVYPGCHPLQLYQEYLLLNPGQRDALHKVLFCDDYVLLWGLPGTGKTYTLALIVRMIVSRQETVLLTSYTHNAVDHIMEKLLDRGMTSHHVMRIHNSSSVSSTSPTSTVESSGTKNSSMGCIAAFKKRIASVRVFVATILTVSRHVLFKSQHIHCSYCVIDEAGQITTPVILAGLLHSHKFILSGDDYQLPPLILSQQAAKKGMAISLLKQLMSIHPHAVSTLYIQYRMNDSIMSLCNRLVYEERMLCGSPEVANRRLSLPSIHRLPMPFGASPPANVHDRHDWLFQALSPLSSVVMLNTDALPVLEKRNIDPRDGNNSSSMPSSSVENMADALIIKSLLIGLLDSCQLSINNDVAVITPFRAQVALLQQLLQPTISTGSDTGTSSNESVGNMALLKRYSLQRSNYDVSTVDKYQGKDRDVVIFNTVKKLKPQPPSLSTADPMNGNGTATTPVDSVGTLLRDWRRINVALTRAKQKLIIVASKSMMQEEPVLKALSDFMTEKKWIIDLLPNSLQAYRFEDMNEFAQQGRASFTSVSAPVLLPIQAVNEQVKAKRDASNITGGSAVETQMTADHSLVHHGHSLGIEHAGKRIRVEYDHTISDHHPVSVLGRAFQDTSPAPPPCASSMSNNLKSLSSTAPQPLPPPVTGTFVRQGQNGGMEINVVRNIPLSGPPNVGGNNVPMNVLPLYGSKMVAGSQVNPMTGPPHTISAPVGNQQKPLQRSTSLPTQARPAQHSSSMVGLQNSQPAVMYKTQMQDPYMATNAPSKPSFHPAYGKQMQPGPAIFHGEQQHQQNPSNEGNNGR